MSVRGRNGAARAAACVALVLAGCGGGSGDGGGNPAPLNIATTELDDGVVGTAYSQTVVATGGSGQKTFSLSGSLPDGLAFSNGTISGTPDGPAGEADITITVTDSASPAETDSQALTIRIADPLVLDAGGAPTAIVGVPYSHALSVAGGIPPYSFSADLPSGLVIDDEGVISGTPAASAHTAAAIMLVVDSASPQQGVNADLRVPVRLEVTTTALPDAFGGVSYSAELEARGGLPELTWEMTGGTLPFILTSSGSAGGTPDASCAVQNFSFDVSVMDSDTPAQSAERQGITLDVVPREVSIPAASAPPIATIGLAYTFHIAVAPGVAPYTFAVTSGSLPPGVTLAAATGQLTGIPTVAGTSNFTVQVTDDCGETDSRPFSLIVRSAPTGRNDSIAAATPIGNGTIIASISPSGHPNSVFDADEDYYVVHTSGQSTITVDLAGIGGEIDTVVELVNAGGVRLQTCGAPQFNQACMNDDRSNSSLDSLLQVRVGAGTTFYIHVVEWRGDARPDLRYRLELSGIN